MSNGRRYVRHLSIEDPAPYTGGAKIAINFEFTPHQLRHTYITELILAGANVKTVQYLAGHADPMVTLKIYTHIMENQPAQTQAAVLAAFGGKQSGG